MFVKGIRLLRVIAHGIRGPLPQKGLIFVKDACLFTETVKAVLFLHTGVMVHPVIGIQRTEGTGKVTVKQASFPVIKGKADGVFCEHQPDLSRFKSNLLLILHSFRNHRLHPGAFPCKQAVQPVLPGSRHQHIGLFRKRPVKRYAYPHDLVGNKDHLDIRTVGV